jgi:nucleotide-binding universal stress UspA family protein
MFHKILVALDYSDRSRQALDEAIALAKLTDAKVMLMHVLSPSDQAYPMQVRSPVTDIGVDSAFSAEMMQLYAQQLQQFEQDHLKALMSFAREVEAEGIPVQWTQLFGEAGAELCHTADEWKADLIVMGRRGRTGLKEVLLGSVSNYVMHHAPCTVMIVQEKDIRASELVNHHAMTVG